MQDHTNYRPAKCHLCEKSFKNKQDLASHIRCHKVTLSFASIAYVMSLLYSMSSKCNIDTTFYSILRISANTSVISATKSSDRRVTWFIIGTHISKSETLLAISVRRSSNHRIYFERTAIRSIQRYSGTNASNADGNSNVIIIWW